MAADRLSHYSYGSCSIMLGAELQRFIVVLERPHGFVDIFVLLEGRCPPSSYGINGMVVSVLFGTLSSNFDQAAEHVDGH